MGLEYDLVPDNVAVTTRVSDVVNWARKHSLFQYPFVTACCGMEYMATAASRYDMARFGAEVMRFSPRQCDLLIVEAHEAGLLAGWYALVDDAVEEILRYDTPLPFFHRWVLEDLDYRGQRFSKGSKVGFLLASANHDETRFADPHAFDITRQDNAHLGFGVGVHYCLGAPLARAELHVTLQTLLFDLPPMTLLQPQPAYQPTFVFRGLQALPVSLG